MYNKSVEPFEHEWIRLSLKNVSRIVFSPMKVKGVFTLEQVKDIVRVASSLLHGEIYVPLFLLALFGFLRLSNLVPPSICQFNPGVHLARGDLLAMPSHGTLIIKWSKTLQKSQDFATIQIPSLNNSPLCPMTSLLNMFSKYPSHNNAPMFLIPQGRGYVTLTQGKVRKFLKNILLALGLCPSTFPFHTFRRTGASWAFANATPLQDIQLQGTWSSDAVWAYLIQDPSQQSRVTTTFKHMFAS